MFDPDKKCINVSGHQTFWGKLVPANRVDALFRSAIANREETVVNAALLMLNVGVSGFITVLNVSRLDSGLINILIHVDTVHGGKELHILFCGERENMQPLVNLAFYYSQRQRKEDSQMVRAQVSSLVSDFVHATVGDWLHAPACMKIALLYAFGMVHLSPDYILKEIKFNECAKRIGNFMTTFMTSGL